MEDLLIRMKIIFMGTPTFAVPSLEKIYKEHEIISVFTKVDKPNARGKKINYSPIKEFGLANGLKIYQPENFKDSDLVEEIKNILSEINKKSHSLLLQTMGRHSLRGSTQIHLSLIDKS